MERKIGRSSSRARPSASGPHGYQSTGLWACWRRYGLVSPARRLAARASVMVPVVFHNETMAHRVLLDASSLMYRAFFSMPTTVTASDGRAVNAVHGYLDMTA